MKSTYGILWYFFIIYTISVIVNFSHFHKTLGNSNDQSTIISAAKCLIQQTSGDIQSNKCRLSLQYKKETVLNLLKNLQSNKEFSKIYKLTSKNGSKKGTNNLINITIDLKPLFASKNSNQSEQLDYWYSFYLFLSILLMAFVTPLWPLTNYIYLTTMISLFLISFVIYIRLVKLIVFSLVYAISLKKYRLWLLPNLNKDVDLFATFWPLYQLESRPHVVNEQKEYELKNDQKEYKLKNDQQTTSNEIVSSIQNNAQVTDENSKSSLNMVSSNDESIKRMNYSKSIEKMKDSKSIEKMDDLKLMENKISISSDSTYTLSDQESSSDAISNSQSDRNLPTIITTPPVTTMSKISPLESMIEKHRRSNLENVDLNNEPDEDRRPRRTSDDQTANIKSAVSYLNVNDFRRRHHSPARQRIASNRSDDGFEILNNDFLSTHLSSSKDELFVCTKHSL